MNSFTECFVDRDRARAGARAPRFARWARAGPGPLAMAKSKFSKTEFFEFISIFGEFISIFCEFISIICEFITILANS